MTGKLIYEDKKNQETTKEIEKDIKKVAKKVLARKNNIFFSWLYNLTYPYYCGKI